MFMKKWFHFFPLWFFFSSLSLFIYEALSKESFFFELKLGTGGFLSIYSVFLLDHISSCFLLMVSSVSFMVIKYSYWYMGSEKGKYNSFFFVFFFFVFFMLLLSSSGSLFWVILGWDGLGISSFCLVMFFSNWKSFNSAYITFLINRFGDFFFILSIWSSVNFFFSSDVFFSSLSLFLVITAMTKSAQVPFSAWLPAAMAAPTPVSSLVHSSTLVTAGIFLLARFHTLLSENSLKVLFFSSVLTMFISGMSALGENDLKKIIALSTLSHLGFMMFFLSKKMIELITIHLLTHAFFKSLLFMVAGVIIHSNFNCQDIRRLHTLNFPLTILLFISILANMGVPFLSGFYSKEILIFSSWSSESNEDWVEGFALLVSIMFTSMYSVRIMVCILDKSSILSSVESNPFSSVPELKWMVFSSFFSCLLGGVLVWVVVDPCQSLEDSFFLKSLKLGVFGVMIIASYLQIYINYFPFYFQCSKLWFIFEASKIFSLQIFQLSKAFLWEVDLKGHLGKTPNMKDFFLKEEILLRSPKSMFLMSVWILLTYYNLWQFYIDNS